MTSITTERLCLKRLDPSEKPRLISLIGDIDVSRTLSNVPFPYTEADADAWLTFTQEHPLQLNIFLGGTKTQTGKLIGGIGLSPYQESDYELGYWLGKNYWKYGFATEACQGLLQALQSQGDNSLIHAKVYEGNAASVGVLRKCGFKYSGQDTVLHIATGITTPCSCYLREPS